MPSPTRHRVATAKAAIRAFGGLTKTALALTESAGAKVPITTVQGWQRNGIPQWRVPALRDAARRGGIRLPKELGKT